MTEAGSAKFFVQENGDTVLQSRGILKDREIHIIQGFIKQNYQGMYLKWAEYSSEGFYGEKIAGNRITEYISQLFPTLL